MRRLRLGLFVAAFAAWAVTAGLTMLTPDCRDPLGGDCPSNWASDAATVTVWCALALTAVAAIVGIGVWLAGLVRWWLERRARPEP
jgi:hypothetical protein